MTNLENVIQKSLDLNNAICRLNSETKVLNSIVAEKRMMTLSNIIEDLKPYCDAMQQLNIDMIDFPVQCVMYYYEMDRRMGIRIKRVMFNNEYAFQVDLGVYSSVQNGFYSYHSIGRVISGLNTKAILNGFLDKWDYISQNIEYGFVDSLNKILEERKETANKNREKAICELTSIIK